MEEWLKHSRTKRQGSCFARCELRGQGCMIHSPNRRQNKHAHMTSRARKVMLCHREKGRVDMDKARGHQTPGCGRGPKARQWNAIWCHETWRSEKPLGLINDGYAPYRLGCVRTSTRLPNRYTKSPRLRQCCASAQPPMTRILPLDPSISRHVAAPPQRWPPCALKCCVEH